MPPFSISESIRFGWAKVKEHSRLVYQLVLVMAGLSILRAILGYMHPAALGSFLGFLIFITETIFGVGITAIVLKLARNESAAFGDIVPSWKMFWRSVLSGILVALLIIPVLIVGALIFVGLGFMSATVHGGAVGVWIIPLVLVGAVALAIIVWIVLRYSMIRFIAIDPSKMPVGRLGVGDILRESARLTNGVKGQLLLFGLAMIGINILGAIALLVGLLISIPVSFFASAYVYLKLLERIGTQTPAANT